MCLFLRVLLLLAVAVAVALVALLLCFTARNQNDQRQRRRLSKRTMIVELVEGERERELASQPADRLRASMKNRMRECAVAIIRTQTHS